MFFRGKDQWTKDKMSEGDYYKLFRDLLGEQVRKLAPQTDYVSGSPDCGDSAFLGGMARWQAVRGVPQYPRVRQRVRLPVVRGAEDRPHVHSTG